jgi:hypothetical protein
MLSVLDLQENINRGYYNPSKKEILISKSSDPLVSSKSLEEIFLHEQMHIVVEELFNDQYFTSKNYHITKELEKLYDHIKKSLSREDFIKSFGYKNKEDIDRADQLYDYIFGETEDDTKLISKAENISNRDKNKIKAKLRAVKLREFIVHYLTNENLSNLFSQYEVKNDKTVLDVISNTISLMSNKAINRDFLLNSTQRLAKSSNNFFSTILNFSSNITKAREDVDSYLATTIERWEDKTMKKFVKSFSKGSNKDLENAMNALRVRKTKENFMDIVRGELFNDWYASDNPFVIEALNTMKQIIKVPTYLQPVWKHISIAKAKTETAKFAEEKNLTIFFNKTFKGYSDEQKIQMTDLFMKTNLIDINIIKDIEKDDYGNTVYHRHFDIKQIARMLKDKKYLEKQIKLVQQNIKLRSPSGASWIIREAFKKANAIANKKQNGFIFSNGYSILKAVMSDDISNKLTGKSSKILKEIKVNAKKAKNKKYNFNGETAQMIDMLISMMTIYAMNKPIPIKNDDLEKMVEAMINMEEKHRSFFYKKQKKNFSTDLYDRRYINKGDIPSRFRSKISFKLVEKKKLEKYKKMGYIDSGQSFAKINNKEFILMYRPTYDEGGFLPQAISSANNSSIYIPIEKLAKDVGVDPEELREELKDNFRNSLDDKHYEHNLFEIRLNKNSRMNFLFKIPEDIQVNELRAERRIDELYGIRYGEVTEKVGSYNSNMQLINWISDLNRTHRDKIDKKTWIRVTDHEKFYTLPREIRRAFMGKDIYIPKMIIDELFGVKITPLTEMGWFKDFFKKNEELKLKVDDVIAYAKDVLSTLKEEEVMKDPNVWIGNLVSNFFELNVMGLSSIEIAEGFKNLHLLTKRYENDKKELMALYAVKNRSKEQEDRKIELEVNLNNNIINWAFENGMYESTVEDIMNSTLDINKNRFKNHIEELRAKFPLLDNNTLIGKAINEMYMTDKSFLGKMSKYILTHSDFFAKLVLFEKLVKQNNIRSEEDKLTLMNEINEMFINYPKAQNKLMEYMSRTGIFVYSKFLFGVPYILMRNISRNMFSSSLFMANEEITGVDFADPSDSLNEHMFTSRFKLGLDEAIDVTTPILFDLTNQVLKKL